MTGSLAKRFGIAEHELVSLVGAGGKTTILLALGDELASAHYKVILTTTTKLAPRQISQRVCWSGDPSAVDASLLPDSPLFVVSGRISRKVGGFDPDVIDLLYLESSADHVIVEADGARSMSIKGPAIHEPVIPSLSTTVVVVIGADALGRPLGDVAHRPERITELTGLAAGDPVTPEHAARLVLHPQGGLKGIPQDARVVVAITKTTPEVGSSVDRLAEIVAMHPRVERVVMT